MRIGWMVALSAALISAAAEVAPAGNAHLPLNPSEAGQPLLPQPPAHGFVMAPLVPGNIGSAQAGSMDNIPGNMAKKPSDYGDFSSADAAWQAYFIGKFASLIGWFLVLSFAGVMALATTVFYLRRIAMFSAITARMHSDIATQRIGQAKDMASKQLRAYVFTNGAKGEMLPGKNFIVRIEVKNFGVTPAHRVTGWMGVFIDELANERMPAPPVPQDYQRVETILPPGGICYYYAQTSYSVATETQAIAQSRKAIFAHGEIRYGDVFGEDHYVRFRIKCSGERNFASGSFDHCMEGNESD